MARTSTKPRVATRRGFKSAEFVTLAAQLYKEVKVAGEKNGFTRRLPSARAPRYYRNEGAPSPKRTKKILAPASLRPSITPGTVLILLAGRFRGKRVVFLKQLHSGLLLVTGPFKINGVPLRRVNQAYVIATSTKVDLPSMIANQISDEYFAKDFSNARSAGESEFFDHGKPKVKGGVSAVRAAGQKNIDKAILDAVRKEGNLRKYLETSWGLTNGQFPHQIAF